MTVQQGIGMPLYNKNFELSVEDIELIEAALRDKKRELSERAHKDRPEENKDVVICAEAVEEVRTIHELLGRIHNQKVFFRPRCQTYVGG